MNSTAKISAILRRDPMNTYRFDPTKGIRPEVYHSAAERKDRLEAKLQKAVLVDNRRVDISLDDSL